MLLETAVICGFLVLLYSVYRFVYAPYQVLKSCNIKGPTPVPFFGNYREKAKMKASKYYEYLRQEYGPVSGYYIGPTPHVLVTDLDMLKQIMVKDFNNFMDHELSEAKVIFSEPNGLVFEQGETWKRSRHVLSPTFSASKIKMMVPLVQQSVESLVNIFHERAESGKSFEFFSTYGSFTMETILATAFGRKIDIQGGEADELTRVVKTFFTQAEEGQLASRDMLRMLNSNFPLLIPVFRYLFSKTKEGQDCEKLAKKALELIQARKRDGKKHKDMLQLMIDATGNEETLSSSEDEAGEKSFGCPFYKKAGVLSDKDVVGHARVVLLAGYETISNTLAYTSYLLALNPDIQEKLQSEIDSYFDEKPDASAYEASQEITYLDNVIQESLRLYPPAYETNRRCSKTTVVNGVTIAQGSTIIIPILHLHHDPQYWKDPEKFDPDRFTPEERAKRPQLAHMPFGFGPRSCIGMRFALLEAKMALMELLKKYTFVRAPDTEVPLQTVIGFTMAPKNGIYLKVVNHS